MRSGREEFGSFKHQDLTDRVIGVFYEVYNELGFGYLESVYENAMIIALGAKGMAACQRVPIPVWFRDKIIGKFEADLLVEQKVILELKACRNLDDSHRAQLLNYLRATEIEVGLLLNFGPRPEVKWLAFENRRKKIGSVVWKPMIDVLMDSALFNQILICVICVDLRRIIFLWLI